MGDGGFHPRQSSSARYWSKGRQPGDGSHKRGFNTKLHVAVGKAGHPLRVIATEGTEPDCKRALELVSFVDAKFVLADKAYDSDEIIFSLSPRGIVPIIPPRVNRNFQRLYDKNIYKKRHVIENTFLRVKEWRPLSTRYFKNISSFASAFHIRSISLFAG
ncbi:MAG: transposase [Puniceicoccales bacterium]|nr:transposase [Puniceicoccales bacterium]